MEIAEDKYIRVLVLLILLLLVYFHLFTKCLWIVRKVQEQERRDGAWQRERQRRELFGF
jgi:hypothetical protein